MWGRTVCNQDHVRYFLNYFFDKLFLSTGFRLALATKTLEVLFLFQDMGQTSLLHSEKMCANESITFGRFGLPHANRPTESQHCFF